MNLKPHEIKRFFDIWFPLLHYVNENLQLVPSFPNQWIVDNLEQEDAMTLRNALWEHDELRERFLAENPAHLSKKDLALVESWQYRISGSFFITHYLKSFAVFMQDDLGYGVHGISEPIEYMTGRQAPIFVNTNLLPFEGRIIYDSFITGPSLTFGSGYKHSLNNTYRILQERGGVITELPHDPVPTPEIVRQSNKKTLRAFRRDLGKSGLSPQKMQEHMDNIETFSDTFLLSQPTPVFLLDITPELFDSYVEMAKASKKQINWVSFKRLARFLRDTDRQNWDEAEQLLETVKSYQE